MRIMPLVHVVILAVPVFAQRGTFVTSPTMHVTGRLIDGQGLPVAGATFATGYVDELVTSDAIEKPQFKTGVDGRFKLTIRGSHERVRTSDLGFIAIAAGKAAIRWGSYMEAYNPLTFRTQETWTDTGDLVMTKGMRLRGQTTDQKGKPIAGAYVRAVDLLVLDEFFPFRPAWFTATVTEADGRFTLEGVPTMPIALMARAAGHFDCLAKGMEFGRVAILTLRRSGYVSGKLLDANGAGIPGRVFVDYEAYNPGFRWDCRQRRTRPDSLMPCQVDDTETDGTFRVTIRFPGYFRLRARGPLRGHEVVDRIRNKPKDGLRLKLPEESSRFLTITAKSEKTGKPITTLIGSSLWPERGRDADHYASATFVASYHTHRSAKDGKLRLPGPANDRSDVGSLLLHGEGFAALFVPNFRFPNKGMLDVDMVPESSVSGRVVLADKDRPVAGAQVVCSPVLPPRNGQRDYVHSSIRVKTGSDGSFRIGGLGLGRYAIRVRQDGYQFEEVSVLLGEEEHRSGLVITAAKTVRISGKLLSDSIQPGWQLQLTGETTSPAHNVNEKPRAYFRSKARVDVRPDGDFEFPAQIEGKHRITLLVPDPYRINFAQRTVLESFDLKRPATKLELKVPPDIVTTVRGKVRVKDSVIPMHRLVVAGVATDRPARRMSFANDPRLEIRVAPHTPVTVDGRFTLSLLSKEYRLHVYDAVTGLRLHRSKVIDLKEKREVEIELNPTVCKAEVALRQADGKPAQCTSMRITLLDEENDDRPNVIGPRGRPRMGIGPQGAYVWLGDRPEKVVIYAPPGQVKLTAKTMVSWLLEDLGPGFRDAMGECEFTAKAGETSRVRFVVDRLPEFEGRPK